MKLGQKLDQHLKERVEFFKTGKLPNKINSERASSPERLENHLLRPSDTPVDSRDTCSRATCDTIVSSPHTDLNRLAVSIESI